MNLKKELIYNETHQIYTFNSPNASSIAKAASNGQHKLCKSWEISVVCFSSLDDPDRRRRQLERKRPVSRPLPVT